MSKTRIRALCACVCALPAGAALAATYTVGPPGSGADHAQLRDVFNARNLAPGDVVLVRGGATYAGDVIVKADDGGAPGNPVVIRWDRAAGGTRPVLQGGTHTIKFQQSHHVVFEGFEVRGGAKTCVFNEAHDVTVRDALIHDCAEHGVLGADDNSGSFTLEYSEIFDAGSGQLKHPIYVTSDQVAWPGAVFRMRFNYVHGGNGGNLLKSRHERNEIHYNWFEGGTFQEIELIGPDCVEQDPTKWSRSLRREDSELVGNVIVHTSSWPNAIRLGGDLNGASDGRVRMVNNTIVIDRGGSATAVLVQLGLESLEMHNNVIFQNGGAPQILRENPASAVDTPECAPFTKEPWAAGRQVSGTHNWVQSSATQIPAEWGATRKGASPGFVNLAQRNLRPLAGGALVDQGTGAPPPSPTAPFPSPLSIPLFDPPLRARVAPGDADPRLLLGSAIDIGALEDRDIDDVPLPTEPIPLNGAQPLIPPKPSAASALPPAATMTAAAPAPAAGIRAVSARGQTRVSRSGAGAGGRGMRAAPAPRSLRAAAITSEDAAALQARWWQRRNWLLSCLRDLRCPLR